jgi:hypothetical protein
MNNDFTNLFTNKQPTQDDLLKVAKELFDMYESFIRVGFNETQAFYLIGEILKGGIQNG